MGMMVLVRNLILLAGILVASTFPRGCWAYEPTWESLDSRPLPEWYGKAKIGIFIHWGVFSVPAYKDAWFWHDWVEGDYNDCNAFVDATEKKGFNYPDYASRFDATLYEPDYWADLFAKSGAQYVILTSKHHEGYCMFDSRNITTTWNWNVMEVGPRRDLLGELAEAIRKPNVVSPQTKKPLKFGLYHSLFEFYNPMFLKDQETNFTSQVFVDSKTMPELYHLVETYKPEVIWSDGQWMAPSEYWKSKEFLAWLATNSSVKDTVVWNDRWGTDATCLHGSFLTCRDRYLPDETADHIFENAFTLDKGSWGWNRKATLGDFYTAEELIVTVVKTISRNGNANINIGPGADGTISPIFADRLLALGSWLSVNGEGIYDTRPWGVCNQDRNGTVAYTRNDSILYVHVMEWPAENTLVLSCPEGTGATFGYMLGLENIDEKYSVDVEPSLPANTATEPGLKLNFPILTPDLVPCQHVWVIALLNIGNLDSERMSETQ
jgi:alpha-L-fucosidase